MSTSAIFRKEAHPILSLQNLSFNKLFSVITNLIIFLMILVSVLFMKLNHPVSIALVLIVYTLLVGGLVGLYRGSYWFSYILFLVILGGVLVLFIYITSLASNEKFSTNLTDYIFMLIRFVILVLGVGLIMFPSEGNIIFSNDSLRVPYTSVYYMIKLYGSHTFKLTLFLVIYLLLALLVCVNLIGFKLGALRRFN